MSNRKITRQYVLHNTYEILGTYRSLPLAQADAIKHAELYPSDTLTIDTKKVNR